MAFSVCISVSRSIGALAMAMAGLSGRQAGRRHLDGRIVGLDGVVEQQANYEKSGFDCRYRNIRYTGATTVLMQEDFDKWLQESGMVCRPVCPSDREDIISLDARVHGYRREQMLDSWLSLSKTRFSLVCVVKGTVAEIATIRQYQEGFKVGPLIGLSSQIARALLIELVGRSGADRVVLDVPEPNQAAVALAESCRLLPVFETARMVKGGRPGYWLDGLFGVTSFELG